MGRVEVCHLTAWRVGGEVGDIRYYRLLEEHRRATGHGHAALSAQWHYRLSQQSSDSRCGAALIYRESKALSGLVRGRRIRITL